jgi:pilus assembly protein Flp/PilA
MARLFHRFLDDRSGTTAIEYGLIAAIICLVIVTSLLSNVGSSINGTFTNIAGNLTAAK